MAINRRNIQIFILSILIILTLGFIWGNSLLSADRSSELSGSVLEFIENILERILPWYTPSADTVDTLIRKLAHFSEFMILGIEFTILVHQVLKKNIVIPPFCGLLAALCDETIQIFSEGRGSLVSDVWIDFSGVLLGFVLVVLITWLRQRDKRGTEKPEMNK